MQKALTPCPTPSNIGSLSNQNRVFFIRTWARLRIDINERRIDYLRRPCADAAWAYGNRRPRPFIRSVAHAELPASWSATRPVTLSADVDNLPALGMAIVQQLHHPGPIWRRWTARPPGLRLLAARSPRIPLR